MQELERKEHNLDHQAPLSQEDFNLLSSATYGIVHHAGQPKSRAESHFMISTLGIVVMKLAMEINCRRVVGNWRIRNNLSGGTYGIGSLKSSIGNTEDDDFHTWIETETHCIDLMSPMYPDVFAGTEHSSKVPSAMVQIPKEMDAKTIKQFEQGAVLFTEPDPSLTKSLIAQFAENDELDDLAQALLHWWPKLKQDSGSQLRFVHKDGRGLLIKPADYEASQSWVNETVTA
ncbi:DUF2026 family protein [Cognatishimia activa]|uniref:Uncharacterized protein n=1 Tax=Cognatishimia activa TaxID=1715691 RepID=A0A0P1ISZ4_9RHOB|nr:DUF2026 family protein [Cognatishimia activa]CUI27560.1 hypothetical protein TA5113_00051 [Cognatishimia activa]CUK24244.1 hypothetical protein TA5114_00019 [Cognatishimia activa]